MKKKPYLDLIIIISLSIISCKKDDSSIGLNSLLIGEWKQIKLTQACSNNEPEIFIPNQCEQNGRLIFDVDETYNVTEFELVNNLCQLEYTENGNWLIENTSLTIVNSINSNSIQFSIVQLTDTNLILQSDISSEAEPCNGGIVSTVMLEYLKVN